MRTRYRGLRLRWRGIALILTLFTVAVLITLSTSFAILAFNESRSSRSDKDGKVAYQFATAGVDAIVGYMGANINWGEDNLTPDPVIGQPPSFTLVSPSPVVPLSPWKGIMYFPPGSPPSPVQVPLAIATSAAPGPSGVINPVFTWTVQFNGGQAFPIDSGHDGTITMVVQRAGLPGDADSNAQPAVRGGDLSGDTSEVYLIQSTAAVYPTGASGNPLASRTVIARVRQISSTDNSLYIQASRFFDVPGLAKDYTNVVSAQASNLLNANFTSLENIGGIPFGAQVQGQITVLNAPSSSNFTKAGQTGVLDMFGNNTTDFTSGNIGNGSVTKFGANVSLGQGQAGIQFPDLPSQPTGLQNAVFKGGNSASQGNQLPGSAPGQNAATQYSNTTHSLVPGTLAGAPMVTVDSSTANSFGLAQPLPSGAPPPTQPSGKDIEVAVDGSGNPINGAPPGIANIKITLNAPNGTDGGSVTVQKVGAYSGAPVPFGNNDFAGLGLNGSSGTVTIPVSQLQGLNGGLLYVDGGNIQVNTNGNQDIAGRLTIVAGASSQRPTVDATDPTNPALVVYDTGNVTRDTITGKSLYLDPSNSNFIGSGTAKFPFQDSSGRWHWPAYNPDSLAQPGVQKAYVPDGNQATINAMIQHDDATTREGNLTITSSIQPQPGQQPSLGLLAQNYVLLSDQTNPASNTLNVDATLQSFGHSVQWAGFLNGVNVDPQDPNPLLRTAPASYFVGMASGKVGTGTSTVYGVPAAPNAGLTFATEAAAGHFNLTGSIISPFIDVEGTFNEGPPGNFIGYTNQTSKLDVHAQDDPPPFLPNFNHDVQHNPGNGLNPMSYRIESITDLSASSGR